MDIKRVLIGAMLLVALAFTGCSVNEDSGELYTENNHEADSVVLVENGGGDAEEKGIGQIYAEYLKQAGTLIPAANPDEYDEDVEYEVESLFYHIGDLDRNGVAELACSDARIDGNGVYILTCKDGEVVPFIDTYMPYGTAGDTCTLAEINERFGILYADSGEISEFDFVGFDGESILSGSIEYPDGGEPICVLNGEPCDAATWHDEHGAIELALFFEVWEVLPW